MARRKSCYDQTPTTTITWEQIMLTDSQACLWGCAKKYSINCPSIDRRDLIHDTIIHLITGHRQFNPKKLVKFKTWFGAICSYAMIEVIRTQTKFKCTERSRKVANPLILSIGEDWNGFDTYVSSDISPLNQVILDEEREILNKRLQKLDRRVMHIIIARSRGLRQKDIKCREIDYKNYKKLIN